MLRIDPEFFHHFRPGRTQAEAMQADDFSVEADILVPDVGDASLDRNAFPTFVGQDFFAIFIGFAIETFLGTSRRGRPQARKTTLD